MPPPVTPTAATPLEGVFPFPLHQGSVGFLSGGDGPARLIAKGGVELPGWMAGGQAIVQWLGLRSQGHLFGAGLSEGARAKGQGKALRCLGQQGGQQLQVRQAGLRGVLLPAPQGAGESRFPPAEQAGNDVRPGGAKGCLIRTGESPIETFS